MRVKLYFDVFVLSVYWSIVSLQFTFNNNFVVGFCKSLVSNVLCRCCSSKPTDSFFINDPENGGEDSNVALEKLRDVIAQCILPQAGP